MKKNKALIFFLIASIFCISAPKSFAKFSTVSFDQNVTMKGQEIASFKIFIKNEKMRMETFYPEEVFKILIENEKGSYIYNPKTNEAVQTPLKERAVQLAPLKDLSDFMAYLKKNNAVFISNGIYQGQEAEIYEFTRSLDQTKAKAWVWKDENFPLKIEIQGTEGLLVLEFENIAFNLSLDDSLFELPATAKMKKINPA